MIESKDWQSRLLGLAALRDQHPEIQQQMAAALAVADPDPVIKRFASAIVDQLKHPTTKPAASPAHPASAPTSQPDGPALPPQ